ncbi:MAG TPA: hypothetical protein QF353_00985 [Gammaproteobacteria bacterium]|nr:hypothetical protein [Gammaproteobacteria bacterium]
MAVQLEERLEGKIERLLQSHDSKDLRSINRLRYEYSAFKKYQDLLTLRGDLTMAGKKQKKKLPKKREFLFRNIDPKDPRQKAAVDIINSLNQHYARFQSVDNESLNNQFQQMLSEASKEVNDRASPISVSDATSLLDQEPSKQPIGKAYTDEFKTEITEYEGGSKVEKYEAGVVIKTLIEGAFTLKTLNQESGHWELLHYAKDNELLATQTFKQVIGIDPKSKGVVRSYTDKLGVDITWYRDGLKVEDHLSGVTLRQYPDGKWSMQGVDSKSGHFVYEKYHKDNRLISSYTYLKRALINRYEDGRFDIKGVNIKTGKFEKIGFSRYGDEVSKQVYNQSTKQWEGSIDRVKPKTGVNRGVKTTLELTDQQPTDNKENRAPSQEVSVRKPELREEEPLIPKAEKIKGEKTQSNLKEKQSTQNTRPLQENLGPNIAKPKGKRPDELQGAVKSKVNKDNFDDLRGKDKFAKLMEKFGNKPKPSQ